MVFGSLISMGLYSRAILYVCTLWMCVSNWNCDVSVFTCNCLICLILFILRFISCDTICLLSLETASTFQRVAADALKFPYRNVPLMFFFLTAAFGISNVQISAFIAIVGTVFLRFSSFWLNNIGVYLYCMPGHAEIYHAIKENVQDPFRKYECWK